jgi:hypothetical protein
LDENRRTKREAVGERERAHGREEGSRARVHVEDRLKIGVEDRRDDVSFSGACINKIEF